MKVKSTLKVVAVTLVALVFATPVLAGGWATVTLDTPPGEVRAGEALQLSFVVRQHGNKPIHFVTHLDEPMTPILMAKNVETGETVRAEAKPEEEIGRFTVEVIFPSEGIWQWEIEPAPLLGVTKFTTLTVLPVVTLKTKASSPAGAPVTLETMDKPVAGGTDYVQSALITIGVFLLVALAGTAAYVVFYCRRALMVDTAE